MSSPIQLTLDPWASDYDGEIAIATDGAEPTARVATTVESERWEAIRSPADPSLEVPLVFIDGVRRVEARILATAGEEQSFGLLGAVAVGALLAGAGGPPELLGLATAHLLVLGDGRDHAPVTIKLAGGGGLLRYAPYPVPDAEPDAPLLGLQTAMRKAEAALARALAGAREPSPGQDDPDSPLPGFSLGQLTPPPAGALIVADGPLAYLERTRTPLVGFIKSLHRAYLGPADMPLLSELATGERTPIFAILDKNRRYSWYLRLGTGGPAEHPLAGIARLECGSELGIDTARTLADRTATALVRCASTRERDPRSPQNLIPLGGLEAQLRHRLGDRALARRAIITHLASSRLVDAALASGTAKLTKGIR
jgi:hypothetical protein